MGGEAISSGRSNLAIACAWIAFALACIGAGGFVAGLSALTSLHAGWHAMSPLTALCIAALAFPLLRTRRTQRTYARSRSALPLAVLVCALAVAVLVSHALLQRDALSLAVAAFAGRTADAVGKMSAASALCLLLLGAGSIASRQRALLATELLANVALVLAGCALLGYAYNISDLYSYYLFNTMSLPTAASLFLLAVAGLLSTPGSRLYMAAHARHEGGRRARHLLALTALPAVAGWLLVHARAGAQGDSVALALLVMGTSVPMFYLLLEYARKGELLHIAREAQASAQQHHALLLEQEVARITGELAGMHRRELDDVAQLERARRSEVIAQLTGSIAHDFNNLLMVIGGSAQLMKLQLPPASNLLRHVDKITSTVSATAKLTAQLAAFSGTQKLESAPLLVDDMVRAAIADNLALLPANIRFEQQLNAAGAWVMGDRAQLQIAVGHLLRNAGEALAGCGTVAITTRIAPSDSIEGNDSVVISVQDDGAGMSEAVMKNATEPFFTTKQATKHQGLGLAQASSVLHQASGSLQLAAAPGKGSRVEMFLPRHAPLANQAGQPSPADLHALAGERNRRLLVIDDDDDVRTVIAELLRALQYDVTEASDGETGLRKLHEMQPALAIIDYLMPGMNGGEVARKARQQMPSLPILFISGYADSDAIAAIPHAHLLRKPILPRELERAVNGALS